MKILLLLITILFTQNLFAQALNKSDYRFFCERWNEVKPISTDYWNGTKDRSVMGKCTPEKDRVTIKNSICISQKSEASVFFGHTAKGQFQTNYKVPHNRTLELDSSIRELFRDFVAGKHKSLLLVQESIQDLANVCGQHLVSMFEVLPTPKSGIPSICSKLEVLGLPSIEKCEERTNSIHVDLGGACQGKDLKLPLKKVSGSLFEVVMPDQSDQLLKPSQVRALILISRYLRVGRAHNPEAREYLRKVNNHCGSGSGKPKPSDQYRSKSQDKAT